MAAAAAVSFEELEPAIRAIAREVTHFPRWGKAASSLLGNDSPSEFRRVVDNVAHEIIMRSNRGLIRSCPPFTYPGLDEVRRTFEALGGFGQFGAAPTLERFAGWLNVYSDEILGDVIHDLWWRLDRSVRAVHAKTLTPRQAADRDIEPVLAKLDKLLPRMHMVQTISIELSAMVDAPAGPATFETWFGTMLNALDEFHEWI